MTSTKNNQRNLAVKLTESAVMVALGTILSLVAVVKMPFGGDVTLCSMVPAAIIAYRYGVKWGLFTGFAYSLLQLLLGLNNLSYATSAWAAIAIILLDYLVAFTVLGLAGLFRNKIKNQAGAMVLGLLVVCVIRYLCHVLSGCTVWAGVSIPTSDGLLYSLAYNAAYMVPETIVTMAGAFYLCKVFDFRSERVTRAPVQAGRPISASVASAIAWLCGVFAVVFDAVHLFGHMQYEVLDEAGEVVESGFDITGVAGANWALLGILTGVAAVIIAVCLIYNRSVSKKAKQN